MRSLLRSKLRVASSNSALEHPSADLLTAFRERTLSVKDRKGLALHLAICEDCRLLLALSSSASGVNAVSSGAPRRLSRSKAMIAVCGAAAASLIAIGVSVPLWLGQKPGAGNSKAAPSPPALVTVGASSAKVLYTSAEAVVPTYAMAKVGTEKLTWRIEKSRLPPVLQVSKDGGKTWNGVKLVTPSTPSFEPQDVAWNGPLVWVRSSRGNVLTSGDGGTHWAKLRP